MKKRLLCLVLAMCLLAPLTLAEDTEIADEPTVVKTLPTYPQNLFALGDTLFACSWNELYKSVEGGWQRIIIDSEDVGNFSATTATDEGIYLLGQRHEVYNETSQTWEFPDGSMFTISFVPVDGTGALGERELLCDITWDVHEDNWPQFYGMQVVGDSAYLLLHDEDTNWELNSLYRVDLATGKGTKVTENYISELVAYKDGLLLSRWYNWDEAYDTQTGKYVRTPEIVCIDPATGETTVLGSLPDNNSAALVYAPETDFVYFAGSSFVYRFDNTFASAEAVGYLIGSGSGRNNSAATLYKDRYYIQDWQGDDRIASATIDPALLPTRTLRLSGVWNVNDILRDYALSHPDVAIEYIDTSVSTAEDFRSHMQSPQAADIYSLSLPYQPYAPLLKYGLLTDLSSSKTLMDTIGRMYPHLTSAYLQNGKLYGLPIYIHASTMGYYPKALEKVGLTEADMPTTYGELMDFLTDWYYDYYDDYEEMQIFEWSQDLHGVLFSMIFNDQVLNCESRGEPLTLRTPTIQKLLARLDSPEMQAVFDALSPEADSNDTIIYADYDEGYNAIFSSYSDPMPSTYQQWMPPEPMLIRLDEDTDPVLQASLYLLTVNKASSNQDLAIEVLEYIAERLPQDVQTALMPDVNDPIQTSYYEENLANYQESIAQLEKQMEDMTEEERADYEETLSWFRERVKQMEEEERWAFTEEDIAFYREKIAPYIVVSPRSIFTGEDNPATKALKLYLDGARDVDWFISEIDRVVNMMQMENQ